VKVTTAKYYIPSGRCVQKQDYIKNRALLFKEMEDSTTQDKSTQYYTTNKRIVFEHGGIMPDKISVEDDLDYVVTELWRQSLLFNFAVKYHQDHPEMIGNLTVNEQIFNDFIVFVRENNFDYQMEGENELNRFLEIVKDKQLGNGIVSNTQELINKLKAIKEKELINHREHIEKILVEELAEKFFGSKEKIKFSLQTDQQLREAIGILLDSTEYKKILAIN
jgi:carboxyl-terminal processing protease